LGAPENEDFDVGHLIYIQLSNMVISPRLFPSPGIRFGGRRLNLRDLWLHRRTLRRLRRRLHRLRCDALGSGASWGGDGPLHFACNAVMFPGGKMALEEQDDYGK